MTTMNMFVKRPIKVRGEVAYVPLTQGKVATIDAADVDLVIGYNWCYSGGYASTNVTLPDGKRRLLGMHTLIANPPPGLIVDHEDLDTTNNRRCNLRHATYHNNNCNNRAYSNNKSGYKGVSWHKATSRWQAQIAANRVKTHLGFYECPKEAHEVYKEASIRLHGNFSRPA